MAELLDIIVLPMHDWKKFEKEGFRTRDAHLLQHFDANEKVGKILVIDRPVTIPEMLFKRRRWRIKGGKVINKKAFSCLTKVSNKTYVLDIFSPDILRPLFLRRGWWDYIFKQKKIIDEIKKSTEFLGLDSKILFLWSPLSTGVIGKLDEKLIVFDALDNWAKHPEMTDKQRYAEKGYDIIREKADIIFVNSNETQELLYNTRAAPMLILNGVDKEVFQAKEQVRPPDLRKTSGPLVGYAGKLAKRIDVNLLAFLAKKLPEINFVLIGQFLDKGWFRELYKIKNIHFLGDKHYSLLPQYIMSFDICIIPHNVGALECGGDAIKLYEYLAAGKPVVTTNIAGVNHFKGIITIANTREEFLEGLKYWVAKFEEGNIPSDKFKSSISESYSWSSKAEFMTEKIMKIFRSKYYKQANKI